MSDFRGDDAPHANLVQHLGALAVALVAVLVFLALMGIGGVSLAWAALGLWLAAIVAVVVRAPPREEDA